MAAQLEKNVESKLFFYCTEGEEEDNKKLN